MNISAKEMKALDKDSYQVIDIRSELDISYGAIPGSIHVSPDNIGNNDNIDFSKKLIICCARGKNSLEIAENLCEKGYDAVNLEGGYIAWLMDTMNEEIAENKAKDVEQSIRKKYKKTIWSKFAKAINTYELVKPGDKIAVCISGGKDSMLMAKLFQELKRHNKFDFDVNGSGL